MLVLLSIKQRLEQNICLRINKGKQILDCLLTYFLNFKLYLRNILNEDRFREFISNAIKETNSFILIKLSTEIFEKLNELLIYSSFSSQHSLSNL